LRREPAAGPSRLLKNPADDGVVRPIDPEARLYRKGSGKEARHCVMGHALMENSNGLVADACLTQADGHAAREAALALIEPRAGRDASLSAATRTMTRRTSSTTGAR
jgi:hypothetical protein